MIITFYTRNSGEPHAIFVAESLNGIVAWIHIYICPHIQVDLPAEIGGLIVDENERGCGIGQRLMQHAQQWANEQWMQKHISSL